MAFTIASRITAPNTPTARDARVPSPWIILNIPSTNLPIDPPTIPTMIFLSIPMLSFLPIIILAIQPATPPTIILQIMLYLLVFILYPKDLILKYTIEKVKNSKTFGIIFKYGHVAQ